MDFLPGTASLVEEVDKRLMVTLRDGLKLFGTLRSFDQFANIVLEDTKERIYIEDQKSYGERSVGIRLIRGENVVLLGEIVSLISFQTPFFIFFIFFSFSFE
eukprot:TRINITY_DN619_c0_g3_i1.p1 TRINITY_DN619_c0_g3~~TRINITY_DN619_c0_g3_i1.p1  ORF type:complete len:102 (-),score=33.36 TRINITY_DN619_c0_g3_i1:404-709(-)